MSSTLDINPRLESQIESEFQSEKKADAYDTNVIPSSGDRADHDDVEQGRLKEFVNGQHQDVIPDSVDPNFIPVEEVHRALSQRHIQVSGVLLNGGEVDKSSEDELRR